MVSIISHLHFIQQLFAVSDMLCQHYAGVSDVLPSAAFCVKSTI